MNNNNNKTNVTTLSFFDILALINIVLKLTHVIAWSWWIVLWPLWAEFIIIFIFVLFLSNKGGIT